MNEMEIKEFFTHFLGARIKYVWSLLVTVFNKSGDKSCLVYVLYSTDGTTSSEWPDTK